MANTKNQLHQEKHGKTKPHRLVLNRRHFLLGMAAISASAVIPSFISCEAKPKHDIHKQFNDAEFATLIAILNHLFPKDETSPGAEDFNAATYYTWVITDPDKDPVEVSQLRDGIGWTNEAANEEYKKPFVKLTHQEKENVLRLLAEERWGENWLSATITVIFEALLSDPIYGSNTKETGWKWLAHTAGNPRPTKSHMYNPVAV